MVKCRVVEVCVLVLAVAAGKKNVRVAEVFYKILIHTVYWKGSSKVIMSRSWNGNIYAVSSVAISCERLVRRLDGHVNRGIGGDGVVAQCATHCGDASQKGAELVHGCVACDLWIVFAMVASCIALSR